MPTGIRMVLPRVVRAVGVIGLALGAFSCTDAAFLQSGAEQDDLDEPIAQTQQPLFYPTGAQLWTGNGNHIPMCWDEFIGFSSSSDIEAFKLFAKRTIQAGWGNHLNVIISWSNCPTTGTAKHVRVKARIGDAGYNGSTGALGMATLSTAADRGPGADAAGLRIGFPSFWNVNEATRSDMRGLILHEFGHIMGFGHEYQRPDRDTNVDSQCYSVGSAGVGTSLGPLDPTSIMGWSYCNQALQVLSASDIAAARSVYGTAPINQAILWRDTSGQLAEWYMRDSEIVEDTYPGTVPSSWEFLGTGDFDSDGQGDLLWRDTIDGKIGIWLMNIGSVRSATYPRYVASDWKVEAVADFTGDGKADILWRRDDGKLAFWFLNGGTIWGEAHPGTVSNAWQIVGAGDFDGNLSSDILWRDPYGQFAIWFYNAGAKTGEAYPWVIASDWKVEGIADFSGDGRADILWRNTATTQLTISLMNGGISTWVPPGRSVGLDWKVEGLGDFDRNGRADIFWRRNDGSIAIWYMNGGSVVGEGYPFYGWNLNNFVSNTWSVVGLPRARRN